MIQRTKSVDKDIKSVFVNMQIIFNLQWFNVQFFNFMMMQKQHALFQVGILALPTKSCVMLRKLPNFSEP